MPDIAKAREIRLRNLKPLAPPFHRHIAKSKLVGRPWKTGDRVVVYEVMSTDPAGKVEVTEETIIRFVDN